MSDEALSSFLADLRQLPLLGEGQLRELPRLAAGARDPRAFADELVRRGWLTPYQADQLLAGRGRQLLLPPYLVLEPIGEGGMGQVFKARHTVMHRAVALKVVRSGFHASASALERFHREIRAIARLSHPNVVLAHDANQVGDVLFLVMEYVEGTDLARLLRQRGPLPAAEACDYLAQAARGLQHAHERGLVHRDVKPANLLLCAGEPVVKVLDLGLARLRSCLEDPEAGQLTPVGAVMGTPDYLPPEQADDPRKADIRADVYSLGCTAYHLLSGRVPFPGGSLVQKVVRHANARPYPLGLLRPDLPPALVSLVERMMAKRPEDRPQTPGEVADALAPFASPRPAPAPPAAVPVAAAEDEISTVPWSKHPSATAPLSPAGRARRLAPILVLAGFAAGLLSLAGAAVLVFLSWREGRPPPPPEGQTPAEARPAPGEPPPRVEEEEKPPVRLAEGPFRLRHDFKGHTGTLHALAFSPDGRLLVSGGEDQKARLWDVRAGKEVRTPDTFRLAGPVAAVAWSADGRSLALGGGSLADTSVEVWEAPPGRRKKTLEWPEGRAAQLRAGVRALAFSPDGKRLAAGAGPLYLWDLGKDGGPAVCEWQKSFPSYIHAVGFSPDGGTVAAGCHGGDLGPDDTVRLWKADRPQEPPVLLEGRTNAFGLSHDDVRGVVAYAGGGRLLLRLTSDGTNTATGSLRVWEVDPRDGRTSLQETLPVPGGYVFALAALSDGNLLVAAGGGTGRRAPFGFPGAAPAPSPAGVKLWDRKSQEARPLETGHRDRVSALAFSPDGKLLATGSADQTVRVWEVGR